ncbi:DUF3558 family protein [Nonomuraea sp. NN258]|uniref:DUF3558 family protein n=1 Tax=Nonomuraea antri TaxID=2730852 RepID=UPI00156992F9|nr:DUF3558 family protein [Nonomuraea antri]NRQ31849.1 DUF3558 family protein [Nonomuraea antri]
MAKRLRAACAVTLAALMGGCGLVPSAQPVSDGDPTPPARSSAEPARPEKSPETAALAVPADPCRVLTARTRAKLGMKVAKKEKFDVACKWSNEPGSAPPYTFRDLKVTYDAGIAGMDFTEQDAKAGFKRAMTDDYRRPSVFGGAPSVKGVLRQVGSARRGEHFDEGYYVYFVYEIGGARRGEGRAVVRKGNVIVTIGVSGSDVPGRSVRQGRPMGNATAQAMIDAVADQVIGAVRARPAT